MKRAHTTRTPKLCQYDQALLSLQELYAQKDIRWVSRRKGELVLAVRGGLISLEEASRRFAISAEEFASWERALHRHGQEGLKATRHHSDRESLSGSGLHPDSHRPSPLYPPTPLDGAPPRDFEQHKLCTLPSDVSRAGGAA